MYAINIMGKYMSEYIGYHIYGGSQCVFFIQYVFFIQKNGYLFMLFCLLVIYNQQTK